MNGNIIYSYNINKKISEFLNVKKSKKVELKTIMIANNRILVFLKNSYILKFNLKGEMIDIIKLPTKINSKPIFIDSSLLYLDKNNKLSIVN